LTGTTEQSAGLLDTSVFIAIETGRPVTRDLLPVDSVTTVVTFAELSAGVLSATDALQRAQRLRSLTRAASLPLLGVEQRTAEYWAQLRVHLAQAGRRAPVNDLWIAAIAMAHDLPVVTQDDDFTPLEDFPGFRLIRI
jgi:predicted nucleic acid-binding protein